MNVRRLFVTIASSLILGLSAAPMAMADGPAVGPVNVNAVHDYNQKLPQEIVRNFKAIRSDPDPESLVRDAHYWISNESSHYVWYPHIQDMGGVLTGVGTDQIYLLAGWSKPVVLVPLDFDRAITHLHFAYGAAFLEAETYKEFVALWGKKSSDAMKEAIKKHFPTEAAQIEKSYTRARANVAARLNRVAKKYVGLDIPTFITDEKQYQYVRNMWKNNRVFPVCGDLTADLAMLDLAKATKDSKLEISIFYASNAEHYFPYDAKYRRNIIAQPFGEKGLVLRTRQMSFLGLAEEGDYHYNMQTGENFKIWLETTQIGDQYKMLRRRSKTPTTGLSVMDRVPDPSKVPPEIAPAP